VTSVSRQWTEKNEDLGAISVGNSQCIADKGDEVENFGCSNTHFPLFDCNYLENSSSEKNATICKPQEGLRFLY